MLVELQERIRRSIQETIVRKWNIDPPEVAISQTPRIKLGELASPVCLGLARALKKAPRAIAEEVIQALPQVQGVTRVEVASAGYLNFFLDRHEAFLASAREFRTGVFGALTQGTDKVIVEHTNINPNKAAHIGHLRNAAIGDTFVRMLRFAGSPVEVQNYIDNTGVQVADVIVGFQHMEKATADDVRRLIADPAVKFDYYCWDLYARVSAFYETDDPKHTTRAATLKAIEEGDNDTAVIADLVATTIVRHHVATMARINVEYDFLPRESDILHLRFWDHAFALLKERGAIFFETAGKNSGCWVMKIEGDGFDDDKIIVRSNGTVTYVGKDIAYQLWKLGLLPQDFLYRRFHRYASGRELWTATSSDGETPHPDFGRGARVFNVIDVRQSYPQHVVKQGVRALGYEREAGNSVHFSYEMVALTPACAEQLGVVLSDEDRKRPHVEVSGRKGQGVKADDLLDRLEADAEREVRERNPGLTASEVQETARRIAVGALRFFLLKFTRNSVIAFDFKEALNFDGETGPYLQYAAVRCGNILNKVREADPGFQIEHAWSVAASPEAAELLRQADDIWELIFQASRLDEIAAQVLSTMETATLAKHAFALAQRFNLFYHRYRILGEEDAVKRAFYIAVVDLVRQALDRMLDLLGIEVPRRM